MSTSSNKNNFSKHRCPNCDDDDVDTDPSPEEVEKWTPEQVIEWDQRCYGKMPAEEELWQEFLDKGEANVLREFFGGKGALEVEKSLREYAKKKERRDAILMEKRMQYEKMMEKKEAN